MDEYVNKATEHKHEKQELLNKIETLKQKIGKIDGQLPLWKEYLDTDISPQAEADNIEDIPPNIADNTIKIEYDAEQELDAATAADDGNSSVENCFGKCWNLFIMPISCK